MEKLSKPQLLIKRVQSVIDELGLGSLSSICWDNADLVASGEFYEYVIIEGTKKKN